MAGQEDDASADLKLMNTTLKEIRVTSKVFGLTAPCAGLGCWARRALRRRPSYEMAKFFGEKFREAGSWHHRRGRGSCRPRQRSPDQIFFRREHPFAIKQKPNPAQRKPPAHHAQIFFQSQGRFPQGGRRRGALPGGFGTLDEAMETLTSYKRASAIRCRLCSWTSSLLLLVQTDNLLEDTPCP